MRSECTDVELPTYTSIWRIEKRLYKLYDFRLPMPVPVGQMAVFAAIAVPYLVLLSVLGVPFNHTLIWLYVLPPGLATWLATRPVLEGKRLPELVRSQLRYLAEPRIWCRMAPAAEPDVLMVSGRVWRLSEGGGGRMRRQAEAGIAAAAPAPPAAAATRPARRGGLERPAETPGHRAEATQIPAAPEPTDPRAPSRSAPTPTSTPRMPDHAAQVPVPAPPLIGVAAASRPGPSARPRVTVVNAEQAAAPPVEEALAGPSARRGTARASRVSVVPGGFRPGKPDQLHRDRARAQQPIATPSSVVVLGCTVGAGQTVTTLVTGEVLASLREERVAGLDLNPGAVSLAARARSRPALSQAASLGPSRLTVLRPYWHVDPGGTGDDASPVAATGPADDAEALLRAIAEHDLVLADPSTASVPRLLPITDQLVLVAPASSAAASAIGMTLEWLEAHGQAALAAGAIMVFNGVSRRSMPQVEQAERVCVGRCRAIVAIPWDDQLKARAASRAAQPGGGQHWAGVLAPATVGAYTAMAGVLVAALAERSPQAVP